MSAYRTPAAVPLTPVQLVQFGISLGLTAEQIQEAVLNLSKSREQEGAKTFASGDFATNRRNWFMDWYYKLGFSLQIPVPPVPDEEYKRRQAMNQDLFYRPPTSEVSYEALMKAVGQDEHWTVVDESDRKKIVWEPAQTGYWFWAEVAQECPRLGTSWNKLTKEQRLNLLSLEEYALVWWVHKAATSVMLDNRTWSWLRTRFGPNALDASGCLGRVRVCRCHVGGLADPFDFGGGRCAEVVKM